MTERENALLAYNNKPTEWIPLSFDCLFHVGIAMGNEDALISEDHRDVFGVKWVMAGSTPTPDPNEPSPLQKIFREEFYTYSKRVSGWETF